MEKKEMITQVRTFGLLGVDDERFLNEFLKDVYVVDIMYIGTDTHTGVLPTPLVLVVYKEVK